MKNNFKNNGKLKIILLSLFFIFYLSINICIDPSGLLKTAQEKNIAEWLNQGYGVVNAINIDYRKVIRERIALMNTKPTIVVMGSSRAMVIDSSMYPGRIFLNLSLPSANLEDIIANYQILYKHNKLPAKLVICPDVHYFNSYYRSNFHLFKEFNEALERMGISKKLTLNDFLVKLIDPRYIQILSPSYFQESIRYFPAWIVGKIPRPSPIVDYEHEEKVIRPDGSIIYESSRRQRTQKEIDLKAERYAFKHPEGLLNYREIDNYRKYIFESFLKQVKADGVEIEVLFIPIHPRAYEILSNNKIYKIIIDVENYMKKIFELQEIKYVGSYSPSDCGVSSSEFYDAVHVKPEALKRLLAQFSIRD
ncbi:MAG: hypothetical protein N3G21_02395 [Candidatus Hydrogenedentes bacterium]|nr:hypothetical protein [Candidatus Hydrogenedentota bacterium]